VCGNAITWPGPQASLTVNNTIVAHNTCNACGGPQEVYSCGPIYAYSGAHNLYGAICGVRAVGDLSGIDAKLGPLQDNGGLTLTHALLAGSPAVDAGDNATCPTTDQRGVARPVDGDQDGTDVCDIGAYEAPEGTSTPSGLPAGGGEPPSGGGARTLAFALLAAALVLAGGGAALAAARRR
jgi:hypothetical protein